MEIKQLRYFAVTAKHSSLVKAAAALGIGQPALGRQIAQLERELGVRLLFRNGKGIRLSPEGTRFLESISQPLSELLEAQTEISSAAGKPAGNISVAIPPFVADVIGENLVRKFMTRCPNVGLHVRDGYGGEIQDWLVSGMFDVALTHARRTPSMRLDPVFKSEIVLSATQKLLRDFGIDKKDVSMEQAMQFPLILPWRHTTFRRQIEEVAASHHLKPINVVAEVDSLITLRRLVEGGVAGTIVPYGSIRNLPGIKQLRVVDPAWFSEYMIAYSPHAPLTLGLREFVRVLRSEIAAGLQRGSFKGSMLES